MKKNVLIRRISTLLAAVGLSSFILIITGCEDKNYFDPNYHSTTGNKPSDLDFSTTQKISFELDYDVPDGMVSTFLVYSENPFAKNSLGGWDMRPDMLPIASGIQVAGISEIVRTLPAYTNELYLYSPSLFVPTLMHATINNGKAVFKEVGLNMPIHEDETTTRSFGSGSFDHYLTGKKMTVVNEGAGMYYYRPPSGYILKKDFPVSVSNAINSAFPEKVKADPKYYDDASIYIFSDDGSGKGADLWVSVISARGEYNNSLAYFCYDGPKENLKTMSQAERDQLYVVCAFQFAKSSPTMYGALRPGEYVKLKYYNKNTGQLEDKFPVGTTIGWVLSSDGFIVDKNANCYTANRSSKQWFYSVASWNPEAEDNNHTIIFTSKDGEDDYICFGFEDNQNGTSKGDGDCNDVMFHVLTDPGSVIVPPPYIPEDGTIEEADSKFGYIAFEDNWPEKGDYDLNDVVAKYESSITYVQKTRDNLPEGKAYVKRVMDKISLVHTGADFVNSFGFKIDIPYQSLTELLVDNAKFNVTPDGNGFLVELCSNVNEVIVPYQYGTIPKEYNIMMTFSDDPSLYVTQDDFNKNELPAPYNPYISPSSGIEVHLPMYTPTSKANKSFFGTKDDRSGDGKWYVSGENNYYPFAIHLSGATGFTVPKEGQSIDKTYPQYINWVESGNLEDKDWYLYPAK